jgi:hypothetical protein
MPNPWHVTDTSVLTMASVKSNRGVPVDNDDDDDDANIPSLGESEGIFESNISGGFSVCEKLLMVELSVEL